MSFLVKILFTLCLIGFIGGFGYAAIMDVQIQKQDITKPLKSEQYIQK